MYQNGGRQAAGDLHPETCRKPAEISPAQELGTASGRGLTPRNLQKTCRNQSRPRTGGRQAAGDLQPETCRKPAEISPAQQLGTASCRAQAKAQAQAQAQALLHVLFSVLPVLLVLLPVLFVLLPVLFVLLPVLFVVLPVLLALLPVLLVLLPVLLVLLPVLFSLLPVLLALLPVLVAVLPVLFSLLPVLVVLLPVLFVLLPVLFRQAFKSKPYTLNLAPLAGWLAC